MTRGQVGPVRLASLCHGRAGIEPGQVFEIERIDRGEYRLRRVAPSASGLVGWLLSCPEKDYFVSIDSDSTDTL